MDAWSRLRKLTRHLWPVMATVLAVFLQYAALFAWGVTCGVSAEAMTVWAVAVSGGLIVAAVFAGRFRWTHTAISALSVCSVIMVSALPVSTEFFFSQAVNAGLPYLALWLVAAIPIVLAALFSGLLVETASGQANWKPGLGIGLASALFLTHGWIGIPFAGSAVVVAGLLLFGIYLSEDTTIDSGVRPPVSGWMPAAAIAIMTASVGMAVVAGGLLLNRLFTVSIATSAVATLFCCLAFSLAAVPYFRWKDRPTRWWMASLVAASALPWCFGSLLEWNLVSNAAATSGPMILLRHGFQLSCWAFVLLIALNSGKRLLLPTVDRSPHQLPWFTVGAASCFMLMQRGVHPGVLVALPVLGLMLIGAVSVWFSTTSAMPRWSKLVSSTLALAAIASFMLHPPDLAAPSRLMFDGRPLLAIQRGFDPFMIPETDAARLISLRETTAGTVTTWRTQANRVELRVNGHVVGEASTDTGKMPQPAAEVLTSVLPLVLHPHPGSVLLLNDASGVALNTCREFPLHRLVFVEPEASLVEVPLTEEKLITVLAQSETAVVRDRSIERVDVMIDCLVDPARPSSSARLSLNWYQAAASRLTADGVLCQRLRQQRVSSDVVRQVLGTVSAVFRHTAVVQLVPGELAIVATNSQTPLLDKGTLRRMERQHVRRELGRSGWDWCQLAALPVVYSDDPKGLWQAQELPPPANAASGAWNLGMVCETLRYTNNATGLHDMLAPYQMRIADAVPAGESHKEFGRRISAYAQQVELSSAFPDEWWSYRNSLKSEMLRNTRPPVEELVNGEIVQSPHPLDEFRKKYLVTLGKLMNQLRENRISVASLNELNDFSVDYEPLLSDFAHHELVRIHELGDHPAPVDEFRHRLHTVYYSVPGDYSLRNVVGAIQQLTDQPELIPEGTERYDQLNSLVQQLVLRWEARMAWPPRSAARTQRDVELSVRVAQKALLQMEDLASEAGLTADDFMTRRQYVAKSLIVPLRQYKEQVLAHRLKESPMLMSEEDLLKDEVPMLIDDTLTTN